MEGRPLSEPEPSLGAETKVKSPEGSFLGDEPSLSSHKSGGGGAGRPVCRSQLCRPGRSPGLAPAQRGAELFEVVSPTLQRLPGTRLVSAARAAARPGPSVLLCVWLCRE